MDLTEAEGSSVTRSIIAVLGRSGGKVQIPLFRLKKILITNVFINISFGLDIWCKVEGLQYTAENGHLSYLYCTFAYLWY